MAWSDGVNVLSMDKIGLGKAKKQRQKQLPTFAAG
jgi:hypothetical protein